MVRNLRAGRFGRARLDRWLVMCSLAAAAVLAAPGDAHAWTEAVVRSAHAEVTFDEDATARVALTVEVRVHGGWLEGFELAGFDPDLELDEETPPVAVDEEGQRYMPRASIARGGRILLSFRRSPRRGRIVLTLAYRTSLAHRGTEPVEGEDFVRVRWRLPGWSAGLDDVRIDVLAPVGSRVAPDPLRETESSVDIAAADDDAGHTVITWRRAHLPRTVPWTVAVDVPAERMAAELRGTPIVAPPPTPSNPVGPRAVDAGPFFVTLAVILGALALLKLLAVRRLARLGRSRARSLLFGPWFLRAPLALGAFALGGFVGPDLPFLGLGAFALGVVLVLPRPGTPPPPSHLGTWRAVDARWLAASRRASWWSRVHPATLLDATTPLGALHALAWLTLPWTIGERLPVLPEHAWLTAVLVVPLLATGTRWAFPSGPTLSLSMLLRYVASLRELPDGVTLRPMMHVDVHGRLQEARVRLVLAHRPNGLLRADFALSETPQLGGYSEQVVVHIVCRAGSPADRALDERLGFLPVEESLGGRRRSRTLVADRHTPMLAAIVKAFEGVAEAPGAARGTACEADTVRQLPAPAAVGA